MSSQSKSREEFAAQQGAYVNQNNGIYVRGESYGYAKKLEVAAVYRWAREKTAKPNLSKIARECSVSWHFVDKIKNELILNKRVLRPSVIRENKDIVRGPGAQTLDEFDQFVLLQLHSREPSRSLKSYVQWLFEYAGTVVSESTVSCFFLHAFPIRGGFVKPNLVPYDKFRPENKAKAYEYLYMLSHYAPERVKFGDEKSLKGQELFSRRFVGTQKRGRSQLFLRNRHSGTLIP